jgi:hypothetical protein
VISGNEISKEQLDKLAKVLERNDIILNTLNEILGHIRFKRTFSTRLVKGGYTPRYIKSNMTNNTNTITNSATNNSNSNNTTNDRDVSMSLDKEPVYNDVIIKNDSDQDKENENEPENNTQKLQSDDDNAKGKNENNNQRPSLPLTTLSDEFPVVVSFSTILLKRNIGLTIIDDDILFSLNSGLKKSRVMFRSRLRVHDSVLVIGK